MTFVGAGRACTASTFSRSGCTQLTSYRQPKEVYGWGLYMHFLWVEHNSILAGYLHEVPKMGIMFCLSAAMNGDVIGNSDTSRALFEELVYPLLEDVLQADQTKGTCRK